jgi:hypothetical protein
LELKVNAEEWAGLSKDEQSKIEEIVNGFFPGAQIVPDPTAAKTEMAEFRISNPLCKVACEVAQKAAQAACLGLGNPIAVAACMALAQAAGDECRRRC